ncbi:hypothetical protein MASR2M78_32370 [Treponema sp.]
MKFKLLVVDDEKNIREGLAAALELDGHDVVLAADGDEGWKRFQRGDVDLVITDLRMPGISGEELLKRIGSEAPGVPVLVPTVQHGDGRKCRRSHAKWGLRFSYKTRQLRPLIPPCKKSPAEP